MYDNGQGVAQDYIQAFQWYSKGVEKDDPNSINNLGYMYQSGHGIAQDYVKAFELYTKAAEKRKL
jgi:hypothetical protein